MYGQKKLIDRIRRFSPEKEYWKSKPPEELPKKVTVDFEAGQSGVLDMTYPQAVIWARLLELQQRYNKPAYVEIDPESQVITRLLLPQASQVMSITERNDGDVDVDFYTSQAHHYLRHDHPDFQTMLDALQQALDEDKWILVTATREDNEIIDVRPNPNAGGAETTSPSSPPQEDPPVSPQRAQQLFDLMNSNNCDACNASCSSYPYCIPFKHATDGCYARAHEMCRLMMDEGEDPEKVWIYTGLHVQTSNMHQCDIYWSWHVAPTLMVTNPNGPPEKHVIDPSLCTGPVTVADWKGLQSNPNATLRYSTWEPFWSNWYLYPEAEWESRGITDPDFSDTNYYLERKCGFLQDDCAAYGPPPYICPIVTACHFIVDRSTYSESEIDAMLQIASTADINAAFYVVVDGYSPDDLGITAADVSGVPNVSPTLGSSPSVNQMSLEVIALDIENPSYLRRRQRITWTYKVAFSGTNGFNFSADVQPVTLTASIASVSGNATLYLIKQPNPYEIDGETSWLSTDLRVFQVNQGQSKFNITMGSNASAFITQVINNLNSGNTGGQTFENDISVNQQTSRLELSQSVGGTPVYNFAVAKVRYRSLVTSATDVRVFFRLFPWATSSVAYNHATAYRRYESASKVIPLLGLSGGELTSIPCFASPRVNSAVNSLTTQTDAPNVQTIPADAGGAEVVRYFGCWLDFNQTQPQFPSQPSPTDGPYASGRISIQDHVRNEHQCLVSEIAFSLAPIPNGALPSTSDKLAQRNLAIVESANPGLEASRRIPQTFDIRPTASKSEHDELLIDWGNVPVGSVATLFLPDFNTNDILQLASRKYHYHRLVRIDAHTLKFETGGISYIPIPFAEGRFPGLLTIDLPEGVKRDQSFTVVVRQVSGEQWPVGMTHRSAASRYGWRHIVGSFQLTIPVRNKAEMLPAQQRLLSNLRWVQWAIPANDRWLPVFDKYVAQVAQRVDALGGDADKVAPSPSGEWQAAFRNCLLLSLLTVLLLLLLIVGMGTLPGGAAAGVGAALVVLLVAAIHLWKKTCRPTLCQILRALLAGSALGTVILVPIAALGLASPQLLGALVTGGALTLVTATTAWLKDCF